MPAPYTGGCLCGQVRYTIAAEPLFVGMCWCRDCQRVASGSAVVAAQFPETSVTLSGEIASSRKSADSGNTVERLFCPACGTQILGRTPRSDDPVVRIRVGTLDNPEDFPPQVIIWASSAPKWAMLDSKLPSFPKAPPPRPLGAE